MADRKRYLSFLEAKNKSGSTRIWLVVSKHNNGTLGTIEWYGPWRKYCYFPEANLIFDAGCMEQLANFLRVMNEQHHIYREKLKRAERE